MRNADTNLMVMPQWKVTIYGSIIVVNKDDNTHYFQFSLKYFQIGKNKNGIYFILEY